VQIAGWPFEASATDHHDLNKALQSIRSRLAPRASAVELSIQEEGEKIFEEVKTLDPMTQQEANLLAAHVGEEYLKLYNAFKKSDESESDLDIFQRDSRALFRKVFAIALRFETSIEKIDRWFSGNPKTWHFISEFVAIPGAVVAADIAIKANLTVFQTVGMTYVVGFSILGAVWGLPKSLALWSTRRKHSQIFESFLVSAQIPVENSFGSEFRKMSVLGQRLGYPASFPKCALQLRRLLTAKDR
jgi:hypothetical protein